MTVPQILAAIDTEPKAKKKPARKGGMVSDGPSAVKAIEALLARQEARRLANELGR